MSQLDDPMRLIEERLRYRHKSFEGFAKGATIRRIGEGQALSAWIYSVDNLSDADAELLGCRSLAVKIPTTKLLYKLYDQSKGFLTGDPWKREILVTRMKHRNEVGFYAYVSRHPLRDICPHSLYGCAAHFGDQDYQCLIMEDLSSKTFVEQPDKVLTHAQILQVVSAVARLQAHSFVEDEWRDEFLNARYYEPVQSHHLWLTGDLLAETARNYEEIGKLYPMLSKIFEQTKTMAPVSDGSPTVICNGDLHRPNLLWSNANPERLISIVDWQCVHTGSPVEDLIYCICSSTDADYRRVRTVEILEFFYKELCRELIVESNGETTSPPFTLQQLYDMYAKGFATMAVCAVLPLAALMQRLDGFSEPKCEKAKYATQCYVDVMKEAVASFEDPASLWDRVARR
ncbi:Protein F59B1.10, partial [Aphelenchoides avenae]